MRLLLLLAFVLLCVPGWAQAPAWQWTAASAGDADHSEIVRAVTDAEGNVIVLGRLKGVEATFGATTLRRRRGKSEDGEAFVAKLSAAGEWRWAVLVGGLSLNTEGPARSVFGVSGLAVDGGGNVVVCGTYADTLRLGAHTLLPVPRPPNWGRSLRNAFVISLDAAGHWRWALACDLTPTSRVEAVSVAVDAAGAATLLGVAEGAATFGGKKLPDAWPAPKPGYYQPQYFVARVTPAGQWARVVPLVSRTLKTDTTGNDQLEVTQIAVDGAGNVGVAGFFWGTLALGSSTLTSPRTSSSSPGRPVRSLFVAKLSARGRWQWAAQASQAGPYYYDYHNSHNSWSINTAANALTFGRGGRLYFGGCYEGGLRLTPRPRAAADTAAPPYAGAFVAALSPKGRWEWLRAAPDANSNRYHSDQCAGLAPDPTSGDVLATGFVYHATAFDSATVIRRPHPLKSFVRTWFLVRFTATGIGRQRIDRWDEWSKRDEWGDGAFVETMAVGPPGAGYVAGRLGTHCFVTRLNAPLPAGSRRCRGGR